MTFKIAMLTTENMTVNGKPKIFFNEEGNKNLKREYKVYKNLFKMVIRKVRNDESLKIGCLCASTWNTKELSASPLIRIQRITPSNFPEAITNGRRKKVAYRGGV